MTSRRINGYGRQPEAAAVDFSFDGEMFSAREGDTLASALLANDVALFGRSFKYHRPRGVMSAGSEEANALVAFDRGRGRMTPNVRATTLEVFDGLSARSQNHWPSLKFDVTAINNTLSRFFPAGFYNKTFMWPKSFWQSVYEPAIRRTAGLGPAPQAKDPDCYKSCYSHCETLIVGAGPAGLSAALAVSQNGGRVILVDDQSEMGGSLLSTPNAVIDGQASWPWLAQALETLASRDNVTLLPRSTAIGYYHDNFLAIVERNTDHVAEPQAGAPRETLHKIRAGEVILATGAIERPLVFPNNDRPGVMLASAAQTFLNRYGVAVGSSIVLYTSHDSAYHVAFEMAQAGLTIAAIVDTRTDVEDALKRGAERHGIHLHLHAQIVDVSGRFAVKAARIQPLSQTNGATNIACDSILMCGGWTPSVHLWSHSKGGLAWAEDIGAYCPDRPNENAVNIGACGGDFGLAQALNAGAKAGGADKSYDVANDAFGSGEAHDPTTNQDAVRGKAFVDFQNDVTQKDVELAVREGFKSIEHVKRYTTTGMATDQGKTSNLNGLRIASSALGRKIQDVGLTTFRPPYTPTTFGVMAGNNADERFDVVRKTPIDPWAQEYGAVFEPVSLWRRARYFPKAGEDMHAAVNRECKATRTSVGMFDASTLGKIEVVGPDAAEFLERVYTNPWKKLGIGRCRYGLLLGEDGYIRDDGVIGRLAEDRFHVTTTTGGAPRVLAMMEDYLQTEWPELKVWLTSITEQWAVIALNGPNARKLIRPFVSDIDLSPDAFTHMSVKEGKICDVPMRLFRVSFTGELGFEINVPAHYGQALWDKLFEAGKPYDLVPYGTEAMHVMRAEKGYIIIGQDTDGTVTPGDAGLQWAIGKKKADFIGKRSLSRPDVVAAGRRQLVGLFTKDPTYVLEEGAQIVAKRDVQIPARMIGHVTSSYWSEALGRSIALALVEDGRALEGSSVFVPMPGQNHEAEVCPTIFLDPAGERLNVA